MTDAEFMLQVLSDGRWHSRDEIIEWSKRERGFGLTPHSRAPDLRKRGHVVVTEQRVNSSGRRDSFYRLVGSLNEPDVPVRDGCSDSLSVPADSPTDRSTVSPSSPVEPTGGTLILFECEVDESAGLRGAYSEDAA